MGKESEREKKVNGERVRRAWTYEEGGYWRWKITTDAGEYVDGGNFSTREEARESLAEVFDCETL